MKHLEKENEEEGIRSMKHELLASLMSHFSDMESNGFLVVASFLDPRYKLCCFSSSSKAAAARQMVLEEYE